MTVENVECTPVRLRIWARSDAVVAVCPGCAAVCTRIHSRYHRRIDDTAIGGRQVAIVLTVRCSSARTRPVRCAGSPNRSTV